VRQTGNPHRYQSLSRLIDSETGVRRLRCASQLSHAYLNPFETTKLLNNIAVTQLSHEIRFWQENARSPSVTRMICMTSVTSTVRFSAYRLARHGIPAEPAYPVQHIRARHIRGTATLFQGIRADHPAHPIPRTAHGEWRTGGPPLAGM